MSGPSPEQRNIIKDTSRIRIVRAAPGSGKTWLVGQIIKKELETWNKPGGIAALSFTRVGGEEIRNAVGYELNLPHFVGTLDSFLFRYIVKPFWNKIHPDYAKPRLIPAECGAEKWTKPPEQSDIKIKITDTKSSKKRSYNLLMIKYSGLAQDNSPIMTYPRSRSNEYDELNPNIAEWAKKEKKRIIKNSGWMTHADVALCSYKILNNSKYGKIVSNLIVQKFPFIVIDELQDTGFFAGKTILELLKQAENIKSLLVGDPNQAIYEFNGATPFLFNQFKEIGKEISLETSRRCPSNVVALANCLITNSMKPNEEMCGKNILISYKDFEKDIPKILSKLNNIYHGQTVKYITRSNKTVYSLKPSRQDDFSGLGCPALTHMSSAVQAFYQGNNKKAFGLAESAISLWLFSYEGVTEDELSSKKIKYDNWKEIVVACLLDCVKIDNQLTYEEWQKQAGVKIEERIQNCTFIPQCKKKHLKPNNYTDSVQRKDKGCDVQMYLFFPSVRKAVNKNTIQTIHSVKGQTHDATVLIVPPIGKDKSRCPSELWWSLKPEDQEEKRIAYVAMTRSRKDFYLVVSEETAQNLKKKRQSFYNYFEIEKNKDEDSKIDDCDELF